MKFRSILSILVFGAASQLISAATYSAGPWTADVDGDGRITLCKNGNTVIANSTARWGLNDILNDFSDCKGIRTSSKKEFRHIW